MQDKAFKLVTFFCLMLSLNVAISAEEKIQIVIKKSDIQQDTRGGRPERKKAPISFLSNGMRQALTNELVKNELNPEDFWKKIEEKKMSDADEINLFRPYFNRFNIVMDKPASPAIAPSPEIKPLDPADPSALLLKNKAPVQKVAEAPVVDQFQRATFNYEFDQEKIKTFFLETMNDNHDESAKVFYIIPEINISEEMSWMDVGVANQKNFSGVIVDSWKKWVEEHFKNFPTVVVLEKDFTKKSDKFNPESVTLKWISTIKKSEVFQDRKSARFEVNAQFVLVNTKSNQSLLAFDFPLQKREVGISNTKDLSSNLASLIFNLLNSQTVKINSALELNRASSTLTIVDIKVTGKHGLFDITQINSMLAERFKNYAMNAEMKSYSMDNSVISIKSTMNEVALYAILAKDGGKFILNEQKILLFSPENKAFAIIPKQANN